MSHSHVPYPGAEMSTAGRAATLSNAEIAARVVAGETALFELLMRRHNRLVFHVARGIVGDDAEAQDVVQDTYLLAFLRLDSFRGPRGFSSWLTRIARNEALQRVRRSRRWTSLDALGGLDATSLHSPDKGRLMSATRSPDAEAMGVELLRTIEAAVDRLPEEFRVVFMLRAVEQLGVAETAACLGLNPATVKTRFHRARARLRETIGQDIDVAAADAFSFGGSRCDCIVATVMARISNIHGAEPGLRSNHTAPASQQLSLVTGTGESNNET